MFTIKRLQNDRLTDNSPPPFSVQFLVISAQVILDARLLSGVDLTGVFVKFVYGGLGTFAEYLAELIFATELLRG